MSVVRAHFDGKVFVPEEPVDCPRDVPLRLIVESDQVRPLLELVRMAETFSEDPDWPSDGATEHNHYLYGTPKNDQ